MSAAFDLLCQLTYIKFFLCVYYVYMYSNRTAKCECQFAVVWRLFPASPEKQPALWYTTVF